MPKDEWGVKRLCPSCSTRFYDLQNDPMTCPNCGAVFDLESLTAKKSPSRAAPEKKAPAAAAGPATESDEEDAVVLDDDDDDAESGDVNVGDDILEEDDDETVDLDDIADVPAEEEDS
ncbi:MAG: TIGR02300 family protein [Pseudomonadota bacterium]